MLSSLIHLPFPTPFPDSLVCHALPSTPHLFLVQKHSPSLFYHAFPLIFLLILTSPFHLLLHSHSQPHFAILTLPKFCFPFPFIYYTGNYSFLFYFVFISFIFSFVIVLLISFTLPFPFLSLSRNTFFLPTLLTLYILQTNVP